MEPLDAAMRAFVRLCLRFENHVSNSKYTLMELLCRKRHPDHLRVRPALVEIEVDGCCCCSRQTPSIHSVTDIHVPPKITQAALPLEVPPGKGIPVISRLKTTAAIAALWGLDPEAEGPAAAAAAAGAAGAAGEGGGERLGLHLCSDSYFAAEGAVVDEEGGEGGGDGGKKRDRPRKEKEEEEAPGSEAQAAKRARAE